MTITTVYDDLGRVKFSVDACGVTNAFDYDVAGGALDELQAVFLEQWQERRHSGRADLLARPAGATAST